MPDLALVTAGKVRPIDALDAEIVPTVAGVDIDAGEWVIIDGTTGKAVLADASAAGTADVLGLALRTVKANTALGVMMRGWVDAYDLDALAYGAPVYLSDTAGAIGTTVGTVTKRVGTVFDARAVGIGSAADKILRVNGGL